MRASVWVTGGSGFVGRHLQSLFAAEHPDVSVIATGQELDITDPIVLKDALKRFRPQAVIHLAAIAAPALAKADPERTWAVNLDGTRRLGHAILQEAPQRCRLVFAGSSEAYGQSFNLVSTPLTEDAPLRPINVYGATKAAADIALRQLSHEGLDLCCFRAFNHSGAGQTDAYVVPSLARQVAAIVKKRSPATVWVGNLNARRDFTHVADIARAYMLAALDPAPFEPGRAYNLASGLSRPVHEVLDRLIAAAGCPVTVEVDPGRVRANEIETVAANVSAIEARLGWRAELSLDALVKDVLAHALAEP